LTYQETLDEVDRLIEQGRPALFITANLHYAMLSARDPRLQALNQKAAFLVADGMPLVWYSRLTRRRLPERVAGADLVYSLCRRAAERRHRVFFLGGAPGVAEAAAAELARRYPGLEVAGTDSPRLEALSRQQHAELLARIRRRRPHLLLAALGQPKGELWLSEHLEALAVPVSVQVGASFDFVAGRVARAPRWMQRVGLEWLYRAWREPRRLGPRYFHDGLFLARALLRDLFELSRRLL
jgi:N-acetylglucosaminyldiphosphoundecaprenol N-acetyl-beta-D-mannosaminyltransferase